MTLVLQDSFGAQVGRPIPAKLVMFSDAGSVAHVLCGALAAAIPPPWNLATMALFSGYELSKRETPARTGGKFIEFGIGLIGAGLFAVLAGAN